MVTLILGIYFCGTTLGKVPISDGAAVCVHNDDVIATIHVESVLEAHKWHWLAAKSTNRIYMIPSVAPKLLLETLKTEVPETQFNIRILYGSQVLRGWTPASKTDTFITVSPKATDVVAQGFPVRALLTQLHKRTHVSPKVTHLAFLPRAYLSESGTYRIAFDFVVELGAEVFHGQLIDNQVFLRIQRSG